MQAHRLQFHISTAERERSTWDILWSCVVTIFACIWVSLHPNIPGRSEGALRVALKKLELMIWAMLAPELIICWALRQWLGARRLAKKYHGPSLYIYCSDNIYKTELSRSGLDNDSRSLHSDGRLYAYGRRSPTWCPMP